MSEQIQNESMERTMSNNDSSRIPEMAGNPNQMLVVGLDDAELVAASRKRFRDTSQNLGQFAQDDPKGAYETVRDVLSSRLDNDEHSGSIMPPVGEIEPTTVVFQALGSQRLRDTIRGRQTLPKVLARFVVGRPEQDN